MPDECNPVGDESARRRLSPVAIVFALLVVYPLSMGPMFKLVTWMDLDFRTTFTVFWVPYFPILWLAERVPWFAALLEWYLKFFTGQS